MMSVFIGARKLPLNTIFLSYRILLYSEFILYHLFEDGVDLPPPIVFDLPVTTQLPKSQVRALTKIISIPIVY